MKRIDVYEVSRRVQTTELDFVEFMHMKPLCMADWAEAPSEDDEPPKFVRHRSPVIQLRHPGRPDVYAGRPDVYLAIGPELFELLAPAVDVGLHKLCKEQTRASERLVAENRGLRGALERTEGRLGKAYAEHLNLSDRIGNFHQANVLTRIWRAIRRAI